MSGWFFYRLGIYRELYVVKYANCQMFRVLFGGVYSGFEFDIYLIMN